MSCTPPCTSIPLALHLGHGLRPMNRNKEAFAYVRAQRKCFFAAIRMAHWGRGNLYLFFGYTCDKITFVADRRRSQADVAEWQTHQTQNLAGATS